MMYAKFILITNQIFLMEILSIRVLNFSLASSLSVLGGNISSKVRLSSIGMLESIISRFHESGAGDWQAVANASGDENAPLHYPLERSSGGRVMTFIKMYSTANYSKCIAYLLTNKARISTYERRGRGKSILK